MKHFPFPIVNKDNSNCLDCYRCLRKCPLDAIEFSSGRARIITESCVVCGECIRECPQKTKRIISDMDFVVRALNEGKPLVLSVGEMGLLALKMPMNQMAQKAYNVGFDYIEEMDVLEEDVIHEVEGYVRGSDKLVLSSHCPVIVNLVEQHFPEWIENLLPLTSLASLHAKDLKKRFPDHMVVHAASCPAEFYNRQNDEDIDYLITLSELERIIRYNPVVRNYEEAEKTFYMEYVGGYAFSVVGNLSSRLIDDDVVDRNAIEWYSGLDACIDILKKRNQGLCDEVQFLELMACSSGCVTSVDIMHPDSVFGRCLQIKQYNGDRVYLPTFQLSVPIIETSFEARKYEAKKPDGEQVRKEMDACFNDTDAKPLNCGACGYDTCYAKSAAVVRGEATRDMCISYLKAKAESFANSVVNNIESGLLVFDKDYTILQMNPYIMKMFGPYHLEEGQKLSDYVDVRYMRKTVEKGEIVRNVKIAFKDLGIWTQQTIQPLDSGRYVAFIVDITDSEKQREQFNQVKRELLVNANQVIDDQMRTAQEIANRLGETTAATKITLLKLIQEFEREKELT
ncbi:MAG: [Fe-Fe] hydrogenase large subunit C-terminal domain-containing protein [Peptococcaceae bacterium]|nr:[Fe-Fe] hydrogenase large subunit C-terminal domain-containing protein [Peptococcaceae bacterium]